MSPVISIIITIHWVSIVKVGLVYDIMVVTSWHSGRRQRMARELKANCRWLADLVQWTRKSRCSFSSVFICGRLALDSGDRLLLGLQTIVDCILKRNSHNNLGLPKQTMKGNCTKYSLNEFIFTVAIEAEEGEQWWSAFVVKRDGRGKSRRRRQCCYLMSSEFPAKS